MKPQLTCAGHPCGWTTLETKIKFRTGCTHLTVSKILDVQEVPMGECKEANRGKNAKNLTLILSTGRRKTFQHRCTQEPYVYAPRSHSADNVQIFVRNKKSPHICQGLEVVMGVSKGHEIQSWLHAPLPIPPPVCRGGRGRHASHLAAPLGDGLQPSAATTYLQSPTEHAKVEIISTPSIQ